MKVHGITSTSLIHNTGAPQGCILSTLIVRFADDSLVVGLIIKHNGKADVDEMERLSK